MRRQKISFMPDGAAAWRNYFMVKKSGTKPRSGQAPYQQN
jgi:hypothetical protein